MRAGSTLGVETLYSTQRPQIGYWVERPSDGRIEMTVVEARNVEQTTSSRASRTGDVSRPGPFSVVVTVRNTGHQPVAMVLRSSSLWEGGLSGRGIRSVGERVQLTEK